MKCNLYNGDCLEVMDLLIKEGVKVDLTVTSPPYFKMRKYTNSNLEIGQEETSKDYLYSLKCVFEKVYILTNARGSCFVNLADKYDKNGCLMCLPDRFKIMMLDLGWICKNEIIWHKPNAIPSSAKNRFTNDYEKIYFFTKSKKYNFNTQYEKRKTNVYSKTQKKLDSKYMDADHEATVRQGMNKNRGSKLIEKRNNLPSQKEFVDFIRRVTTRQTLKDNTNLKQSTIDHWFRYDEAGFSYPKIEDWKLVLDFVDDWSDEFNRINKGLMDISYEYDDINKNSHKGRIKRAVWSINTKPSKVKHFAPYPEELIKTPILSASNENSIILDPFMGSGTTGVACKNLNRDFIGIELDKNYYDIAKKRIQESKIDEK